MKQILNNLFIVFFLLILSCSGVYADVFNSNGQSLSPDEIDAVLSQATLADAKYVYIYSATCASCAKVKEWLEGFHERHPDIILEEHDISLPETMLLLEEYKVRFNLKFPAVPIIFVGDLIALQGVEEITNYFEPISVRLFELAAQESGAPVTPSDPILTPSVTELPANENKISLPLIIGAALLDGINPCAFAVLVFLLIYLMSQDTRKKMLLAGLVYTFAVFIFYYLSGVGIFTVVQTAGISEYFSKFAGILSILFGIIMVKDVIFPSKGPTLAIPESRKAGIDRWIKKATLPAAFILGILVGMFELPCTGGIYLAILSMIALQTDILGGLFYLLLYNIIFIVPLLIILAAVYYGMPPEKVNEWRLEKRLGLRFGIGIIMILLGIVILTGILY